MNSICPPTILIKNTNLDNSWALSLYAINKYGMVIQSEPNYTTNKDKYVLLTKDVCLTIEYTNEALLQIKNRKIHQMYPHHIGFENYEQQLIPGTKQFIHASNTFHYFYGGRLRRRNKCIAYDEGKCNGLSLDGYNKCEHYNAGNFTENECYIDQLKFIAEHLDSFNKRLEAITWYPEIDMYNSITDGDVSSVPCMQRIQLRNLGNGYYQIFLMWRSRDIGKAYLWNILALVNTIDKLVQESREKLGQPKLELVKVTDFITCAHIYEPEWESSAKVPVDVKSIENCIFI